MWPRRAPEAVLHLRPRRREVVRLAFASDNIREKCKNGSSTEEASKAMSAPIQIIDLWPRESECVLCGEHLWGCKLGLPMYEGEVVPDDWPGEWAGFDVCAPCYVKHRPGTKKPLAA